MIENDQPEIIEHRTRAAHKIRAEFLQDWQRDEGARMDASGWHPSGSTTVDCHDPTRCYAVRSGHTLAPAAAPSLVLLYVDHQSTRYCVRFELAAPGDRWPRPVEVRPLAGGARSLTRKNRVRRQVEDLAYADLMRL